MKKLFKDYISVIFGTGFARGLSFVTMLMLVRILTVEGFGRFSMFFTVMMLVWQLPASIDAVYVRYAKAEHEKEKAAYLRTAFFMKLCIFFMVCAAAYPLGWFLSVHVFQKPDLTAYLSLAIVSGGFLSVFSSLSGIYQAEERFAMFSIVNAVFYILVFLPVCWFFFQKVRISDFDAAAAFSAAAALVGTCAGAYLFMRLRSERLARSAHFSRMFHFGKWLFAETLLYVILQRLDILFLARHAGYSQIGVYSAAVRIAMVAGIMTSSATAIFMPRGCGSLRSGKHLRDYFKEASLVTAGLTAMIAVLIVVTPVLVQRLFGSDYISGVAATRILLLEAILVLLYTPFSFLFYANGQTRKIFAFGIVRLIVMIIALAVLVPMFGPAGAASSIAVSSFAGLAVAVVMSMKILGAVRGECESFSYHTRKK
ncbi:MAG: oligosaccharide flippase family protein [Candidatus Omnitrophica bacterium]|nr:oligosaccharide flippase family protein [Candidatus Omnitrophota bacterium]